MARLGMDVDQITAAGNALKQRAADIDALVSKLDGIVRTMPGVWEGPDAEQFVNDWWPEHKKTLVAASSHVAGLGQSALNNAAEQRQVSDSTGLGHTLLPSPTPPDPTTQIPSSGDPGPVTSSPSQASFDARKNDGVGVFAPGGDLAGQCTSWVHFRRAELGLPSPIRWVGDEFVGGADRALVASSVPSPGAVGSYDNPGNSPQHTFIVENVNEGNPKTINISEMNYGTYPNEAAKALQQTTGYGQVHTDTYSETSPGSGVWRTGAGAEHKFTFAQ